MNRVIEWTCCDPGGVTFCVSCGEDIKRGHQLPWQLVTDPRGDA